ncbi:MAG TPA: hypothetical protein VHZ97_13935 [Pseudonocardiaceae bacterium]|nr:hypothetical protein [Pseudonocardiaceae bacterium]
MSSQFCSWCGKPDGEVRHDLCQRRLALVDPPRYCAECARRMVVQVTPAGWTAKCSRHGETTSAR